MNQTLKRAAHSIYTFNQLSAASRALPAVITNFVIPSRGYGMKQYMKEYRWALHGRKQKEKFKFPERHLKPNPRYGYVEWNYKAELFAFGKRLKEEFDDGLLREALTDQSYVHRERLSQEKLGIDTTDLTLKNNSELAELGVSISKSALLEFLQKEIPGFPAEGHQSLLQHLTSEKTLADVALNLGLTDLILCEEYPPSAETFSRAMYAVIGALEKSSGMECARKFIIDFLASLLCGKDINDLWNIERPWKMMVEIATQKGLYPVEPRIIAEAGRNTIHAAYIVGVYDKDKKFLGKGTGETIDIAQEMAARDVLKLFFNTRDTQEPFEFQSANIPYKLIPHVRNINK